MNNNVLYTYIIADIYTLIGLSQQDVCTLISIVQLAPKRYNNNIISW